MKDKHYNLTGELDRKPKDKPPAWMNDDFFKKLEKPEKKENQIKTNNIFKFMWDNN